MAADHEAEEHAKLPIAASSVALAHSSAAVSPSQLAKSASAGHMPLVNTPSARAQQRRPTVDLMNREPLLSNIRHSTVDPLVTNMMYRTGFGTTAKVMSTPQALYDCSGEVEEDLSKVRQTVVESHARPKR
jgi:hypothetical protein